MQSALILSLQKLKTSLFPSPRDFKTSKQHTFGFIKYMCISKMLSFVLFYHPDTGYNLFAVLLPVGAENHGATSTLRTGIWGSHSNPLSV